MPRSSEAAAEVNPSPIGEPSAAHRAPRSPGAVPREHDGVLSGRCFWLPGIGGENDELLPEAFRVLARELPGEGVEIAHALHGDQERFIGGEPRVDQDRELLPQMVFQLRDVDGVDRLPAAKVAPPLVDLLLERYR